MTLTIQDLGALGEFFGSIAVLATLIYLTVQTRQNAKALQAQAEGDTLAAQIQFGLASAASKELSEAWFEGEEAQRDYRRRQHGIAVLSLAEWYFYQGEKGLLPFRPGLERHVGAGLFQLYPGLDRIWEASQDRFRPEFVEFIEEQRSKAA